MAKLTINMINFTRHERNVREYIEKNGNEISMVSRNEVESKFSRADIDGMLERNILTRDKLEGREMLGIQMNEKIMEPLLG